MRLETYLSDQKLTDAQFASQIGISRSMVTRFRSGVARPSAKTALAIEKATNRLVTLHDLLSMPVQPTSAEAAA